MNARPTLDPRSPVPLWRQLEDGVRQLVGGGAWLPGAPVPSVRALAADLLINPATVAKAYQRLVDQGVLVVRRGDGTFVAERPPVAIRDDRQRTLREAAERYAAVAAALGAGADEAVEMLRAQLVTDERNRAGGKR